MRGHVPLAAPYIGPEERAAVDRVLASGMLAQGPEVAAFEAEFAMLVQGRRCAAVNSGTSALHLALLALGVGPGDEVLVPSFSFAATANVVALTGAAPVFVDIEASSFCMDPAAAAAAVTSRTRAMIPVHLYGHPAAMERLQPLADAHGIAVLEDAAQAHAASLGGVPVGAFGAAAAFSFYPTKNMTTGEGGMVVSADAEVDRRVRLLRNQGMERRYENEIVGFNARLTDFQAAIGRVQLGRLAGWTRRRQENAAFLDASLQGVTVPSVAPAATHVYHQYTVRVPEDRDGFAAELTRQGVGNGVYYPVPIHRLASFASTWDLPETERAARECLSLPVHPGLTTADLERVVEVCNNAAGAGA